MIVCAAAVGLAAGLVAYSPAPVGVFWDDAVYVITAKALATGQGYRFIHLPGAPSATHYPPLWPAILSIVWRIDPNFPENVRWMKFLNPIFLGVAAAGSAVLAVRAARVPMWLAAVMSAVTVVVAPILLLSAVLMSEPLALALSAPALAAATVLIMRGRTRDALIAGLLVGLAILARSAAIVLLPSLAVGVFWRRSRRASLIALAVALVLAGPWFVWSSAHAHELPPALAGSYGPYGAWLIGGYRASPSLIGEVVGYNSGRTFTEIGVLIFGAFPRFARAPLMWLLMASTVTGLFFTSRRMLPLLVALVAYLALVLIWPYAPGRFVWTYYPLYAVAAAAAVGALVRRARTRRAWRAPSVVAAAVACAALLSVVRYDVRGFMGGWHRLAIEPLAEGVVAPVRWIAQHTAPTDTIASDVHLQAYLYAGRVGVPLSSLTVQEYVIAKPDSVFAKEYDAIDAAYHPQWWIATSMTTERPAVAHWAASSGREPRFATNFPDSGLAVRMRTH